MGISEATLHLWKKNLTEDKEHIEVSCNDDVLTLESFTRLVGHRSRGLASMRL